LGEKEVVMKCSQIDYLEVAEGKASQEILSHIQECKKCSRASEKYAQFFKLIAQHYSAGKTAEEELDRQLGSLDFSRLRNLPQNLAARVEELRERSLVSRLRRVLGGGEKAGEGILNNFLSTRLRTMTAAPKDITKSKRSLKKGRGIQKRS
jgi:hypothetical protein